VSALSHFDDGKANLIISEAHALHTVEAVLLELLQPTLEQIGDLWHQGKLSIAAEHFGSSHLKGHLHQLIKLGTANYQRKQLILTCAPYELHEIGLLILAVLLRRAGYGVSYLGADTPIQDLYNMLQGHQADGVMISSTTAQSLGGLLEQKSLLLQIPLPIIYGGRSFDNLPQLAKELGGYYLGQPILEAIQKLSQILNSQNSQIISYPSAS
ncbi:MAG: cobalamin B12-binding domain-containing protein, partial [Deinococcales bacterium]